MRDPCGRWKHRLGRLLALLFLCGVVVLLSAKLLGIQPYAVITDIGAQQSCAGDLVFVSRIAPTEISAGTRIAFQQKGRPVTISFVRKRIETSEGPRFYVQTAEKTCPGRKLVYPEEVLGVPCGSLPTLGLTKENRQHPTGWCLLFALAAAVLLARELAELLYSWTAEEKENRITS